MNTPSLIALRERVAAIHCNNRSRRNVVKQVLAIIDEVQK